jgi:hypothetical protein
MFGCYYNFIGPHRALKFGREVRTPSMQAGLTRRQLTFREIFAAGIAFQYRFWRSSPFMENGWR